MMSDVTVHHEPCQHFILYTNVCRNDITRIVCVCVCLCVCVCARARVCVCVYAEH